MARGGLAEESVLPALCCRIGNNGTRGGISLGRELFEFGENAQQFGAMSGIHNAQTHVLRLIAFGPCAIGQNNFMLIEHEVYETGLLQRSGGDALKTTQQTCCDQDFVSIEPIADLLVAQQHSMMRRNLQILTGQVGAKRPGRDANGLQLWFIFNVLNGEVALTAPDDFLVSVVSRQDPCTNADVLNRDFAELGLDQSSGRETGAQRVARLRGFGRARHTGGTH